ncbi:MAG: hypothetical protein ACRCXK_00315 [Wohlfahrtiimonas sp.]
MFKGLFKRNKITMVHNGKSIQVSGNGNLSVVQTSQGVFINGKKVDGIENEKQINLVVTGDVTGDVYVDCGDIKVNGSVGNNVKATSGSIKCGDVKGSVKATSGNISALTVEGNCSCTSGNITTVKGDFYYKQNED